MACHAKSCRAKIRLPTPPSVESKPRMHFCAQQALGQEREHTMNPRSGKRGRSILRLSLQINIRGDQLLTQTRGGGSIHDLLGRTCPLTKASPTGCLHLTPH